MREGDDYKIARGGGRERRAREIDLHRETKKTFRLRPFLGDVMDRGQLTFSFFSPAGVDIGSNQGYSILPFFHLSYIASDEHRVFRCAAH